MNNEETKFNHYCIVELFGHSKIAGHCTEENIAGSNMLRVDVPETKSQPAFTKYYGSSAIYAINPVDEKTAMIAAENIQMAPVQVWNGEIFTKKFLESKPALAAAGNDDDYDDYDNE